MNPSIPSEAARNQPDPMAIVFATMCWETLDTATAFEEAVAAVPKTCCRHNARSSNPVTYCESRPLTWPRSGSSTTSNLPAYPEFNA